MARVRVDDGTGSDWFEVGQGLRVYPSTTAVNLFFSATFMFAVNEFARDEEVMVGMAKIRGKATEGKGKERWSWRP